VRRWRWYKAFEAIGLEVADCTLDFFHFRENQYGYDLGLRNRNPAAGTKAEGRAIGMSAFFLVSVIPVLMLLCVT